MSDQLTARLADLHERLAVARSRLDDRAKIVRELADLVRQLTEEERLLQRVDEVLLQISSKVLGQSTTKIDKLVTHGLRVVFEGEDLEFRTAVERFRGKTAVRFKLTCDGVEAPLLEAYGGGPLAVAGVLLRVVAIIVLGLKRVILLDESLSFVSEQYTEATSKLLRKLCADLDFTILMVTHNPKFAQYADRHYEARRSPEGTIFSLARGTPAGGEETPGHL